MNTEINLNSMYIKATEVAARAHSGQFDKAQEPYIYHVYRVAEMVQRYGLDAACVAVLHDVIEDTETTEDNLRWRFPESIVDAVVALTRYDVETYYEYIERVRENALALIVKEADLIDHLARPWALTDSMLTRYKRALIQLWRKE